MSKTFKFGEEARRESELALYGRILSLRPSVCHKAKNKYTRKEKHKVCYV